MIQGILTLAVLCLPVCWYFYTWRKNVKAADERRLKFQQRAEKYQEAQKMRY